MAAQLTAQHPALRHVIVDGDSGPFIPWSAVVERDGPPVQRRPVDPALPALLLVSGGTTGLPKLIARTHDDYVYNAVRLRAGVPHDRRRRLSGGAARRAQLPAGLPGLLGSMTVGATTVFTADPSPESAFALIDRHRDHRHRAGERAGQGLGAGLRLGTGAADVAAVRPGRWIADEPRGGPLHPGQADPGSVADLRHGRRDAELHPARRSRRRRGAHPGPADVSARRDAGGRRERRRGGARRRR